MRIRSLYIDGFGRFAGRDFGPFERPVTVFHGPNEAGKSTLLEFIRRVLFGFRTGGGRLPASYNDYPPLAGGQHGGGVTIVSDAGETVTIRRLRGVGGGRATLTAASGGPLPNVELSRLLGDHSKDVFQSIFTFTLDELHSEKLLSDDSVNSQIYSAGMGATKLPGALKTLNDDKGNLFLKGGSNHKIARAANQLREIETKLAGVANNAAEYARLTARLREVEAELEGLIGRRREHQSWLDHQRQLENAWGDWNDLNDAERELAELPVIEDFPFDGVSRLETLEERVGAARREYDSACRDLTESKAKEETPVEYEAILIHSADVRKLERGRTAFDDSVRDLPERRAELVGRENSLAATLNDLGADWDEARLENFDLSVAVREEISQFQKRLREGRGELDRLESTLTQAATALQEATSEENTAERELDSAVAPGLGVDQIRQRRNLIRAARAQLGEIDRARREASNLQSQLDSLESAAPPAGAPGGSRVVAAISLVVGIALLIAGTILGGPVLPVGIVAGIALVGIAAYLFASGLSSPGTDAESPLAAPVRRSLRRAETELEDLQSALEREAAPLGLETIDEPSLIAAEGSLDEDQARADEWSRLSEALGRAKDLTRKRKSRTEKSGKAVKEAEGQLEAVWREWRQWLQERGLRETFLPETVVELRGKIELGLTRLHNQRDQQKRVAAIQKDIEKYVEAIEPLAVAFGVAFNRNESSTVAATADSLVELHAKVEDKVRERTAAEADLKKAKRRLEDRTSDLRKAKREMKDLLRSGTAADAENFRQRAETYRQRVDLEEKRRDALAHMQRRSGPGEPLEALKKQLGDTDIQAIRVEASRAEKKRDEVSAEVDGLSTERGSIQTNLDGLTGEEESSRLRVERHRLLEEMRGHARKWTVHTLAENLLKEARGKFERERQPNVVRHAESFFRGITNGRYKTVFSPLGSSEVHVTDAEGRSKQPVQLSRGTREQLFLSLRFGLIRDLGQRSERLPVIVDEALVNFDSERGLQAARAFVELSRTNRVLVFTCHPTVVELFQNAATKSDVQQPEVIQIG